MKPRHEALFAAVIVIMMLSATISVLDTAYGYKPRQTRLPTWSSPEIPQCDSDLWERITEGCDGQ